MTGSQRQQSDRAATPAGYYDRLADLADALRVYDEVSCAEIADRLGWTSQETRAKLMQLVRDGVAEYNAPLWRAV